MRRRQIRMAQHFLDCLELDAAFDHVDSERVPQRMRRDGLFDARLLCVLLDQFPEALTRQTLSCVVDKSGLVTNHATAADFFAADF